MQKKDYYDILGISKNSNNIEIKRAYKRLAVRYHPDRNPNNKQAEKKFKEIKEAYEILIDENKRNNYDQYGHDAFNQNQSQQEWSESFTSDSSDFGDIFGDVFGDIFGGKTQNTTKKKGADLSYKIEITLEESSTGTLKKINIPILQKCIKCEGTGIEKGYFIEKCITCNGSGNIHIRKGFFTVQQTCPKCYGNGKILNHPCKFCHGEGRKEKYKKLSIKIPAGINTNDRIRLSEEGEYGIQGGKPGDLYIEIFVKKHSIFKRKKNNLYCEIPINFSMAALGGKVEVPTLYGKVKLNIPKETQSSKLFRIRNKGIISLKTKQKGNLFCKIIVETPINLNNTQKKLLKKLGKSFNKKKKNENTPKSRIFFDGVKKFFDSLTK
ncbi:molecular chaperone DnaJ [Buchnera aphidicola]|uniref:molecular chaperone DnaJ n=1 Tax=Buchnera aphidicola TaxID=9 RepID=UPI0030EBA566